MKIILDNSSCELVIGGSDLLIDPGLLSNLRKYMSVDVPGAFHSQAFKRHVWDGRKYFLTPKLKMKAGMLPILLSYLDDEYRDLSVEIVDVREGKVAIQADLDATVGDQSMDGEYDFQLQLVKAVDNYIKFRDQEIYFPNGILDAATNAGKTTIIAGLYKNTVAEDKSMLILIHRKAIYKQLVDFMGEVFGEVGQINDKFYEIKPVTVAMVQSLVNKVKAGVRARNDVAKFKILIVDESHRAGANTYKTVLKYSNAYMRVFLSGTALDSEDIISKLEAIAQSGPKLSEIKKWELMDKGISTPVEVRMHLCNTLLYKPVLDYREIVEACIYKSTERVSIIKQILDNAKGPVIVAVDKIEHGAFLHEWLKDHLSIEFTNGKDSHQDEKVQAFKDGKFNVLISTAVLSEGVNLPKVQELIYAGGGKSKIQVKQWMGRSERLHKSKTKSVFYDFYDCGPYIQKHSEARLKVYRDENLPIFTTFDLKEAKKLRQIVAY